MINFFRKKRKKMANDNKTLKYARYAIGEIILVVIGILIALSINNWNEQRKKNIEDFKTLTNLKNEIINNQEELKATIKNHKFVFEKTNELSTLINPNPKEIELKKFDTLMFAVIFLPKFNPITTILSSDKLELIKDEKLKNKIAKWKYSFDNYEFNLKIIYDHYTNHMYLFISENYPIKNLKDGLIKSDQSFFDIDARSILSNPAFENHVKLRSLQETIIYENANELFDIQKKIIAYLELKLGNGI